MKIEDIPEGLVLREVYPFDCPGCGGKFAAKPFLTMRAGLNIAGASCPDCKVYFVLKINKDNTRMLAAIPRRPAERAA